MDSFTPVSEHAIGTASRHNCSNAQEKVPLFSLKVNRPADESQSTSQYFRIAINNRYLKYDKNDKQVISILSLLKEEYKIIHRMACRL